MILLMVISNQILLMWKLLQSHFFADNTKAEYSNFKIVVKSQL